MGDLRHVSDSPLIDQERREALRAARMAVLPRLPPGPLGSPVRAPPQCRRTFRPWSLAARRASEPNRFSAHVLLSPLGSAHRATRAGPDAAAARGIQRGAPDAAARGEVRLCSRPRQDGCPAGLP
jgi:hypothetical protein